MQTGFGRLDFDEARRIARRVGFDVMQSAQATRSCGPGCAYLANDKRYFISMLIGHISALHETGAALAAEVAAWYDDARQAAREYSMIEARVLGLPVTDRTTDKEPALP
jgi:hypothetical protein